MQKFHLGRTPIKDEHILWQVILIDLNGLPPILRHDHVVTKVREHFSRPYPHESRVIHTQRREVVFFCQRNTLGEQDFSIGL